MFLLQVQGQRQWSIGAPCTGAEALLPNSALSILQDFVPTDSWLLNPGDMLYLPPRIAHWGVAQTQCVTYSIGLRAPTLADMLGDLALECGAKSVQEYYRDPALTPELATDTIAPAFVEQARQQLKALLDQPALLEDWFARYMTRPKYPELQELTQEQRQAVSIGPEGRRRYLNGERVDLEP